MNGANATTPSSTQRPASTVAPPARALARQLDQQARLAAAGLAGEHHDPRRARARPPPRGAQRRELLAPADERRVLAARERARQRQGPRVHARGPAVGAQLLDQRARLGRRRHAEVAPQRRAERLVGRDRRRAVPAPRQPPHQHPGGVLGHRIELEPAARVADRRLQVAGLLGRLAEDHQQLDRRDRGAPAAPRAPSRRPDR